MTIKRILYENGTNKKIGKHTSNFKDSLIVSVGSTVTIGCTRVSCWTERPGTPASMIILDRCSLHRLQISKKDMCTMTYHTNQNSENASKRSFLWTENWKQAFSKR